jgi:hypothetical protein
MPQPHNFQIGDNVTVLDYHTSVAPFAWPTACYIQDIQDDYYVMRKRSFTDTKTFLVGRYYPHIIKG